MMMGIVMGIETGSARVTRWLISAPVWGERYVEEFCATALPALDQAVEHLRRSADLSYDPDVRVVVHTDQPERIAGASGSPIECRPIPAGARDFDCMSQAHREVLGMALRGDVVVLLTAGAIISARGLSYCAERLAENDRLRAVLCAVPRVLAQGQVPDIEDAQGLMDWGWQNRHPMVDECTWPGGRSADLSRTFFVGDGGVVVTRQFLPHPLAIRIDGRPLRFTPTIDANLIHCFDMTEMHVATDCRELAMLKLTPADKGYDLVDTSMRERAALGALVVSNSHQRWCASHRIQLRGDALRGCEDEAFMSAVRSG